MKDPVFWLFLTAASTIVSVGIVGVGIITGAIP